MNLHRGLIALFLVGGALLRLYGLTDHGLWIDEYGTWWAIAGESFRDCWDRVLTIHGQSPLYYFLVRASVELGGTGLAFFRLPSLLSGLGLLAVAYPLALRIFRDRHTALLVLAAVAVDDRLIYYAQEARPYGLTLLCMAGSFYFYAALLGGGGRREPRNRLGYVLATALTYYAHYLFGIVIVVQAIHLALQRPWTMARLRPFAGTFAATGLLMVPGLFQLVPLFTRRETIDWIEAPSGPLHGITLALELLDPVLLATAAGLVLLVWLRQRDALSLPSEGWPGIPLVWFAVPILAFGVVAPLAGIELLTPRYVAMVWLAVPLLQGLLLSLPRERPVLRWIPLIGFLAVALVTQVAPLVGRSGGPFWWFHQHQWGAAVDEMVRAHRPGDLILYRTGFVELDLMVRGTARPETIEFVEWPIRAHLPAGPEFDRLPLPYRDSPELAALLRATLAKADPPTRVWLIGLDPEDDSGQTFHALVAMAKQGLPLKAIHHRHFGLVHLLTFRTAGASGPDPAAGGPRSPEARPPGAP